jgi:hypothetical protein
MEHFHKNIHGWFNYQNLYKRVVDEYPSGSHFVEVGTWLGKSAAFMAVEIINSKKYIKFDCVDNWEPYPLLIESQDRSNFFPFETMYEKFLDNIKPVSNTITPVKLSSVDASKNYEDKSLDFIFIDADHSYRAVKRDIVAWYPKLKENGMIAGHDFPHRGVKKAVKEFFGRKVHAIRREGCWVVTPN